MVDCKSPVPTRGVGLWCCSEARSGWSRGCWSRQEQKQGSQHPDAAVALCRGVVFWFHGIFERHSKSLRIVCVDRVEEENDLLKANFVAKAPRSKIQLQSNATPSK